jgi:hypothetical protein
MRIFLKNILIIASVIVLFTNIAEGQNKDTTYKGNLFSAEIFINEPYYFIHSSQELDYNMYGKEPENFNNYWNYGGGILFSNYIHKVKVSTGVYLSTKNYYRTILGNKEIDRVKYINIPLLVFTFECGKFNPFVGAIYQKPYGYNNGALLWLEMPKSQNLQYNQIAQPIRYYYNIAFRIGCDYKLNINKYFNFHSYLFFDYKLYKSDITYISHQLYEEKISIGLNIGIEYLLNKNKLY